VSKFHNFSGRKIDPPPISSDMDVRELVEYFGATGFNARRLYEALQITKRMIDSGACICLTLAGALAPIGLGKAISVLIEHGFIDWIVSTGANVYHDLHFAYDLPVRQGYYDVDDNILYSKKIVRIYDVYIKETGTLQKQDEIIKAAIETNRRNLPKNFSTADLCNVLGMTARKNSAHPEKSFTVSAYENDVPIYLPAIADSSIGLDMLPLLLEDKPINPSVILDVAESAAILWKNKISGGIELGGGVPKNFFQQTGPALFQILKLKEGGQDYLVQFTDARPDTGGLSGATLQEGKSWGKIKSAHEGNVIVYGDSSVYFPILAAFIMTECRPRERKKIYKMKNAWVKEMKLAYLQSSKYKRIRAPLNNVK
jgi:deoxyhypusine synthase